MHRLCLLLVLIASPTIAFADEPKPPELTAEEKKLAAEAVRLNREAVQLTEQGRPTDAIVMLRHSLEIVKKLYPESKYPTGHPYLATNLSNFGTVLNRMGQGDQGLPFCRQSLEMRQKLFSVAKYPDGHPDLAMGLISLGFVMNSIGQSEQALPYYHQGLEMMRRLFPASKYPDGHPYLAGSLNNMASLLHALGQYEQALHFWRQGLEMNRRLYPAAKYPDGNPALAISLNNLGFALQAIGQTEQALTLQTQSLEMRQRLYPIAKYPDGHPDIANSLNNLGGILQSVDQAEQALRHYRQGLEMRQKLFPVAKYPDGHPELATSLNNLGGVLESMGKAEQALTYFRQSLEMRLKLFHGTKYPDGHSDLATSLNNLGRMLKSMGQAEQALPYYRQSLELFRKLFPAAKYPDGHPDVALSLNNFGDLLEAMGQTDQVLLYYQQSLDMQLRLSRRELALASGEAAFDKINSQPMYRDTFVSISQAMKNAAAAEVMGQLWPSRSVITRLLEQRQANARAAGTVVGEKLDELRGNRRRTDQLLQDTKVDRAYRDEHLTKLANRRDVLERELLAAIPTLKRWQELDKLGPADLAKALPAGAVFIDVIRYTHFEYVDKKQKRTPSYVAFIVPFGAAGSGIVRVELGDAASIESAITTWRTAIDQRIDTRGVGAGDVAPKDGDPVKASELLSKRVWEPISKHLPKGTKTLYLTLDGDLARMPWAALPTSKDRVLIEDFEIAAVPHGVFLLDQLKSPRQADGQSTFALGGVDYGSSVWPKLPGTESEMNVISALAPGERETASQRTATFEIVSKSLAKARYAHIATHGFFDADAFAKEKKREEIAFKNRQLGDDTRRVASKNPLGYVGLVLADGKVMSGLGIVDLHLENLKLVTLSACETGLGEYTGAKGVENLQMAFHVAGAQNVVASLWKVNDAATAALMAKFYHELWVNKKPPIEALREAQLFIYYNPDKIADALGERGAPKRSEALAIKSANPQAGTRAHTKLWAAFVLSGVGK